eukprot:6192011-Amphidinium_carterae.1
MVFIVPFSFGPYPVGLKFSNGPRPAEAPIGQGDAVRVESVIEGSDADKAGIKAGGSCTLRMRKGLPPTTEVQCNTRCTHDENANWIAWLLSFAPTFLWVWGLG